MDIKKLLMGGIVGGILFFGLGYLIYGNLLMGFMQNHPGKVSGDRAMADFQLLYIAIGNLLEGSLFAYIFLRSNVRTAGSGLVTGGIIGMLTSASFDCVMYGTTNLLSKTMMAADVAAFTVMSAITGAIMAIVMNMGNKNA